MAQSRQFETLKAMPDKLAPTGTSLRTDDLSDIVADEASRAGSSRRAREIAFPLAVFFLAGGYLLLRAPSPGFFLHSTDHGYQLAMAARISVGSLPGVDFITHYGPLVGFSSYLGLAASGGLVGEILICAAGYAAAIALSTWWVRRHSNALLATIYAASFLLLLPRYYKWYFTFMTIISLPLAGSVSSAVGQPKKMKRRVFAWGVVAGCAALFRADIGLADAAFGLIVIAFIYIDRLSEMTSAPPLFLARLCSIYLAGCAALPVAYLLLILVRHDVSHMLWFVQSSLDGATDTVEFYSIRPFSFRVSEGISQNNCLALLQLLIPLVYLYGLSLAIYWAWTQKRPRTSRVALFSVSLLGLGIYPQAMHRADLQHLLQVLMPFLLCLTYFIGEPFSVENQSEKRHGGWSRARQVGAILGFVLLVGVTGGGAIDLGPIIRDQALYWRSIGGLPQSRPADPVADMAAAIRARTLACEPIFLAMPMTQMPMLFFSRRRQSGLFPTYEPGLFSAGYWKNRNSIALIRDAPRFLIFERSSKDGEAAALAPYIPSIIDRWRSEYTSIVYENAAFIMLARPDPSSASVRTCFDAPFRG